jgi:orotate phosphoribosyltransferase
MPSIMPGEFYWWQFYLREALLIPYHLLFIAEHFWQIYEPRFRKQPFQLAGAEQASIPIITALLLTGAGKGLPVNGFTIRKEYKSYGIGNIIEGRPVFLPVVLIDDLTSPQHRTLWHCVRVLGRVGLKLYPQIFVLVYKGKQTDSRRIATSIGTVDVESIFTLDDFVLTWEDYQATRVAT